jgi:hypothetical protein
MKEEIADFIKELVHLLLLPTHDAGTGEPISDEMRANMYLDDKANNRITVGYGTNDIRPKHPSSPQPYWKDLIK